LISPVHIVCLDAPAPPDYGGAIDMFFKIKELAKSCEVILHYFNYNKKRGIQGLETYCREIHSYERKTILQSFPFRTPYIINSRINNLLIDRLNKDVYPVLLEGIHCCGIIPYLSKHRKIVARMHNDEAEYYQKLAATEKNIFKKLYHLNEARLLEKYQRHLHDNIPLACVSHSDIEVFRKKYNKRHSYYIPSFTPWQQLIPLEGAGNYCLYHGNIGVSENRKMAEWLIKNVFAGSGISFRIAGKTAKVLSDFSKYDNIHLHSDPSDEDLDDLIRNAHVNILPSLNNTGLKLKMLHALFMGRHCITNDAGVDGTDLRAAVNIANTAEEYRSAIAELFATPFTNAMAVQRQPLLDIYSNEKNAIALTALLY
jgi:glycosyltransferase involved in cell wall biosynthesis